MVEQVSRSALDYGEGREPCSVGGGSPRSLTVRAHQDRVQETGRSYLTWHAVRAVALPDPHL